MSTAALTVTARPSHEYLGCHAGLDFETQIKLRPRAAELPAEELSKRSLKPELLACSGVTDCYQLVDRELKTTRARLEVLAVFRNPVAMITKNHLITGVVDVLGELAAHDAGAARRGTQCIRVWFADAWQRSDGGEVVPNVHCDVPQAWSESEANGAVRPIVLAGFPGADGIVLKKYWLVTDLNAS
ncbi:MAG: hypothetical protein ACI9MB_003272 [Verrucomicrobiales bacterium]